MLFPQARQAFWMGALTLAVGVSSSHAAGLGPIKVQSALGQQFRASVAIIGTDTQNQVSSCVKAKVESLDGVISIVPRIGLVRSLQAASIHLATRENINEPALNILVELGCEVSVRRTYQILLDPVSTLPTVRETSLPAPSAVIAPRAQAVEVQSAGIRSANSAKPPARAGKNRKRRKKLLDAGIDRAPPVLQQARSPLAEKAKTARRSVLRISPVDEPIGDADITPRLKLSNTLTMPAGGISSPNPADTSAAQDSVAMAARAAELANAAQMRKMKTLQVEADSLRTENKRIKQQGLTDKAALESVRDELLAWVKSLGLMLIICMIAIIWLAWRFNAIRKTQYQASWNEFVSEFGHPSSPEANAVFNNAALKTGDPAGTAGPAHDASFNDEASKGPENVPVVKSSRFGLESVILSNRIETADAEGNGAFGSDESRKREASHKAEEISDVMELVDAWMALHEPAKVLELLGPFINVDHPQSPLPWLCLLDVYSSLNDRKKYEAILQRITTLFNVKLAPWDARSVSEQPRTLANFPHVVEKILALWDSDDVGPYLESLLTDNRDGTRDGFDLSVYRDIARLNTLARDPARPRPLDQFMHAKAYAILFAQPAPAPEPKEDVAPTKNTRADEPAEPAAKPQLRERPKYITTSYQRAVTDKGSSKNSPAIAGNKHAGEADLAGLPDDLALDESERQQPVVTARESDNETVVKKTAVVEAAAANNDMSAMTIKLHLAIAYQDIGDIEGACLLLDEVINEGTPEQCQHARLLLAELG